MKRGDLVTVSLSGDYGKPRPALIIQSDFFSDHPSITLLPITSEIRETPLFRIRIEPNKKNCLRAISQIMIDKTHTVAKDKVSVPFGFLDDSEMLSVNRALAVFLGFA